MSQRSKNLLEAFNQSKAPEKSAEPVAQPRGSAPRVGGPFADSAPVKAAKPRSSLFDARPNVAEDARSPRERLRVVVLCAGIAVIFFFVGRASAPSVQAAVPSTSNAPGSSPSLPPGATAPQPSGERSNDAALLDPRNQATILASTYTKFNDETEKLAAATQARLLAQGLPASISKNREKGRIYLLVGAAPKTSDLDSLLVRVKAATSDRGKQEFSDAFSVPIDNYVVRKTH